MQPKIDPTTKDLLLHHEQLVEDPTMATSVMLRVTTHRGSVPGMPWFGSRLQLDSQEFQRNFRSPGEFLRIQR